jgi:hypothetical protein
MTACNVAGQCQSVEVNRSESIVNIEEFIYWNNIFPTSAEVNETWIYTPTPPHVFMAQCLI